MLLAALQEFPTYLSAGLKSRGFDDHAVHIRSIPGERTQQSIPNNQRLAFVNVSAINDFMSCCNKR